MTKHTQLPHLPLMLAGIPRPVEALLRNVGLPVAPLPRMALTASGAGQFVLFDARSLTSSAAARRARDQGLNPIDLGSLFAQADELAAWLDHETEQHTTAAVSPAWAAAVGLSFVSRLKNELETRGGVWVRLADYPFPYQSALAFALEHDSDDIDDILQAAEQAPPHSLHFVSSSLTGDNLSRLATGNVRDVGWLLREDETSRMSGKNAARWTARLSAFTDAGLVPGGLSLREPGAEIPATRLLQQLGMQFVCRPQAIPPCRTEIPLRSSGADPTVLFGTSSLVQLAQHALGTQFRTARSVLDPSSNVRKPVQGQSHIHQRFDESHVFGPERNIPADPEAALHALSNLYQAGCPVFLRATPQADITRQLQELSTRATRFSLLWQTGLPAFAQWWSSRRHTELQVWRHEDSYEIHAASEISGWLRSIEIWRGQHLATLPLKHTVLNVRDDGLVFLRPHGRSPAGFSLPIPAASDAGGLTPADKIRVAS